ncbi:Transaldolase [Homalodisca vitripennis]|nr:Transaldolase [Homalodisca vitripennis]
MTSLCFVRYCRELEELWRHLLTYREIRALGGCDLLTISPKLLEELESSSEPVHEVLSEKTAKKLDQDKITLNEAMFRWQLNEDQMATDKLSEGIRKFAEDSRKLEKLLQDLIQKK